ncbi:MAG TPA: DUF3500 domain-containing protein [Vicinamibacterales bacterium]
MQFPFESPQKSKWSNLPSPMYQRNGLRLADLTAAQRAVMTLLSTALSKEGYQKVVDIMRGHEVLKRNGGGAGRGPVFGELEYYLAFLGTPSETKPWMLQFGGHHLAINLTMAGSQATMTPSLPSAQPASFTIEGRTVRSLGDENDKSFALINALDAKQKSQAILGSRVADLVLGPGQDGRTIQPEGIRASALSAAQLTMLWDIVHEWSGIMSDAFAEDGGTEVASGTSVAESIIGDMDADRDGLLSGAEKSAYVQRVIDTLRLSVDDRAIPLTATSITFPELAAFRRGDGIAQLRMSAAMRQAPGKHSLLFQNGNRRDVRVYPRERVGA